MSKIKGSQIATGSIDPTKLITPGNASKVLKGDGTWGDASGGGETANVEALTADKTLTATDAPIQMFTCTASRTINLPTTGLAIGQKFEIWNKNAESSSYYLITKQGTTELYRVTAQTKIELRWDGTNWVTEWFYNVSIGNNAYDNNNYGVGIGYGAYGNNGGVGIGASAYNNCDYGVGIGRNARSNDVSGVGIGYGAYNNRFYGVGIGYGAYNNNNYGVGIGYGAYGNNGGVGIGASAYNNSYFGVGIGSSASNNSYNGVGVGTSASSNNKQHCTVALGAYSKAERNREIVSGSDDSTNYRSKFAVQKWRYQDLTFASPEEWKEVFIDGASLVVALLKNAIYKFRIQVTIGGINPADSSPTLDYYGEELVGSIATDSMLDATILHPTAIKNVTCYSTDTTTVPNSVPFVAYTAGERLRESVGGNILGGIDFKIVPENSKYRFYVRATDSKITKARFCANAVITEVILK